MMKLKNVKVFSGGRIKENYVFLIFLAVVFGFSMAGMIRSEKRISTTENRALSEFVHFTINKFLDGSFQDNFENALSDQFLKSESIRVGYGQVINNLPTYGLDKLVCMNRYMDVPSATKSKSRFFNCDDYLLSYTIILDSSRAELYQKHLNNYNRINQLVDVYYYFVPDSGLRDFEKKEKTIDLEKILREDLKGDSGFRALKVDNYDVYKKYFYKTDHHWNHVGQFDGYLDIIKMLGVSQPIERPKELTNHDIFIGSSANATLYYGTKEEFYYYDYDLPEHDTYINGEKIKYGNFENYKNHEYNLEDISNLYAYFYGNNDS